MASLSRLLDFKRQHQKVEFNDSLIASSGTLTLGMYKNGETGLQGVYWSLSLAHLRYYGAPVVRTQAIARESSRITFLQLIQVSLGSLSASWSRPNAPLNAFELAEWFVSLGALFDTTKIEDQTSRSESNWKRLPDWLAVLINASRSVVTAKGREREVVGKLLNVGRKHRREFLAREREHSNLYPCFGLLDLEKLLPMLKGPQQRIWLLRRIVERIRLVDNHILIRYFAYPKLDEEGNSDIGTEFDESMQTDDENVQKSSSHAACKKDPNLTRDHYKSAENESNMLDGDEEKQIDDLGSPECNYKKRQPLLYAKIMGPEESYGRMFRYCRRNLRRTTRCHRSPKSERCPECDNTEDSKLYRAGRGVISKSGEEVVNLIGVESLGIQIEVPRGTGAGILDHEFTNGALKVAENSWDDFEYLFGDEKTAGVYVLRGSSTHKVWTATKNMINSQQLLTLNELITLDSMKSIKIDSLVSYFGEIDNKLLLKELPELRERVKVYRSNRRRELLLDGPRNNFYHSLKALAAASKVYGNFPDSTIAIGIIGKPIYSRYWASAISTRPETAQSVTSKIAIPVNTLAPLTESGLIPVSMLSRAATFSCLTLFESGHCDVEPTVLEEVMALSSGDSIYVTAPLLCDPLEGKHPYEMRRVIGNIGRPGITMLVPPANPLTRKAGPENWNVITHAGYDGKREDSFQGTTLHLSFTGYNPPITLNEHGAQDAEVFLLESVVSVHDHGKWVADLDVLKALGSEFLVGVDQSSVGVCSHKKDQLPSIALTAIDSWDEFLDLPSYPSVVRARGNWVARLSLAVAGINQFSNTNSGRRILLCKDTFCWKCSEDKHFSVKYNDVFIQ